MKAFCKLFLQRLSIKRFSFMISFVKFSSFLSLMNIICFKRCFVYKKFIRAFLLVFSLSSVAIPVHFKIAGFGGWMLKDEVELNDPFIELWVPPEPEDKKPKQTNVLASAVETKASSSAQAQSGISVEQQQQSQGDSDDGSPDHGKLRKYEDHGKLIGAFLEAEIRSNSVIIGINFGGLYSNSKPKFYKQMKVMTCQDKIDKLEERYEETNIELDNAQGDDEKVLKDEQKLLNNEKNKQEDIQKRLKEAKVNEDDIILHNSSVVNPGPIFFVGPYIGYYISDSFSVSFALNVAIKDTKIDVIRDVRVDPLEIIAAQEIQKKKYEKKQEESSQDKNHVDVLKLDPAHTINTIKKTENLGWSIGVMPSIKIGWNLTDSVQVWLLASGVWFFDELMGKLEDKEKQAEDKGKPKDPKEAKKIPKERERKPVVFDGRNGKKFFVAIGLSIRIM